MSEENKVYRKFSEDFKNYLVDDQSFPVRDVPASKTRKFRSELITIEERYKKSNGLERFRIQEEGLSLAKEILEAALDGFNFDSMMEKYTETDLQAMSGEVFGFLSVKRSQKEQLLLEKLSEEIKKL